jgi:hypothetical protein
LNAATGASVRLGRSLCDVMTLVLGWLRGGWRREGGGGCLCYGHIIILIQAGHSDGSYNLATCLQRYAAPERHESCGGKGHSAIIHIGLSLGTWALQQSGGPCLSYREIRAAGADSIHFEEGDKNAAGIDNSNCAWRVKLFGFVFSRDEDPPSA